MINNCYNCDVPHDACNRAKRTLAELEAGCGACSLPKIDPRDAKLWALVDRVTLAHVAEGNALSELAAALNERRKVDNAKAQILSEAK